MPNYLDIHLDEAKQFVINIIGDKELYTHEDAYKLLKAFSYAIEIDFEDIKDYIPSAMKMPDNIYEYTKGFIVDDNYKIYALNYGSGFIIIVIAGDNYITGYYGDTINDFTLKIYYALEVMINKIIN